MTETSPHSTPAHKSSFPRGTWLTLFGGLLALISLFLPWATYTSTQCPECPIASTRNLLQLYLEDPGSSQNLLGYSFLVLPALGLALVLLSIALVMKPRVRIPLRVHTILTVFFVITLLFVTYYSYLLTLMGFLNVDFALEYGFWLYVVSAVVLVWSTFEIRRDFRNANVLI